MNGITKMQEYMTLLINFYGGPGESAHKQFIKIPGQRTQQRVSEFAQQTALQYYNILVSGYAAHDCQMRSNLYKQSGNSGTDFDSPESKGEIVIEMSGKYDFKVTCELIEIMASESKVIFNWSYNIQILKGSSDKYNLNKDYVKLLHKRLCSSIGTNLTGFTKAKTTSTSGECTQFYAHPCFQGHQWHDWALVHFQEVNNQGEQIENHYPSKILGFFSIEGKCEAVIQCFVKPLHWSTVERTIFVKMELGTDFNISFVRVPIEALVHPLCVIPDCSGDSNIYFVVLPKCHWSRLFGERIIITTNT
jgi:hypothetical protein